MHDLFDPMEYPVINLPISNRDRPRAKRRQISPFTIIILFDIVGNYINYLVASGCTNIFSTRIIDQVIFTSFYAMLDML